MSRTSIVLVVVAAFVALLVWLTSGADVPPHAPVAPPTSVPDAARPADVDAATKRPRPRAPTPETASAAASEPDGSPLFPPLDVEVRRADGTWPRDEPGVVYVLRAGASGADGVLAVANLRADGSCTVRLPAAGVYDVGVIAGGPFVWTLATDVDSRTTRRVVLRMPETPDLRFVADPAGGEMSGMLAICADDGQRTSPTPGRGEVPSWSLSLDLETLPTTWRTRSDVRLRYRRHDTAAGTRPERFAAPAVVAVGAPPRGSFTLRVRVEPADLVAPYDTSIACDFAMEGGGEVRRFYGLSNTWAVPAGKNVSTRVRFNFDETPPALRNVLRWKGVGVRDGSMAIDVPEVGVAVFDVVLAIDDSRPLPRSEIVVRVDGPQDASLVRAWVAADDQGVGAIQQIRALGVDQAVPLPSGWTPRAVMASAKGLRAGPIPFVVGGRHELALRPCGCVRIARGVLPPDDVELVLRRKDRMPIAIEESKGERASRAAVLLDAPEIAVGPFPEGDVAFVASYLKTDLVEFTAHVVAGETTDVRLPLTEKLRAQ